MPFMGSQSTLPGDAGCPGEDERVMVRRRPFEDALYPSLSGSGRGNLKVPPVPPSPPPSQATSNGTTPDPAAAADLVGQHAECKGQGIGETQGTVSSGPTGRLLVSSPCQPLAHVRHCDAGQPHRVASTDLDHARPLLLPAPAYLRLMCFTAASPTSLSLTKRTV